MFYITVLRVFNKLIIILFLEFKFKNKLYYFFFNIFIKVFII